VWEHTPESGCAEPSGDACDSWNRWHDDIALVRDLGLGSYRFSIEWSRIEPEEGEWSRAAVDQYRRIGEALLVAGIVPVVTFHHFTTPRWLSAQGGWIHDGTVDAFARFCERAASELAPVLGRACTINEPNIVAVMGYLMGMFPPGVTDLADTRRVIEVMCRAHERAVDAIRSSAPGVPVGLTLSMTDYQPVDGGEATAEQTRALMEDPFLDVTGGDDFIGVQAYSRMLIGPRGPVGNAPDSIVLPMGYEYWPEALAAVVRRAWSYTSGATPIYVTENGIGTDDDALRVSYVEAALAGLHDCMADGVDVRGYTYWSLLDNFEWAVGYGPRFGLVSVDRETFARSPKPSAARYAEIVATSAI
jgi:beta-glucosidase